MFLDTSIIVDILLSEKNSTRLERIFDRIKDEQLYISIIQLGELSDWCLKNGIDPDEVIPLLREITNVLPLSENIILNGSKRKFERRTSGIEKFSLMDGIILASSIELNEKLLTLDTDYRNLENVIILE